MEAWPPFVAMGLYLALGIGGMPRWRGERACRALAVLTAAVATDLIVVDAISRHQAIGALAAGAFALVTVLAGRSWELGEWRHRQRLRRVRLIVVVVRSGPGPASETAQP